LASGETWSLYDWPYDPMMEGIREAKKRRKPKVEEEGSLEGCFARMVNIRLLLKSMTTLT
jgi:hypothetical protein